MVSAVGDVKMRKLSFMKFKFDVTSVCDYLRIFYSLRIIIEKLKHFRFVLQIKIIRAELYTRFLVNGVVSLYANKHLLGFCILFFDIMHIICSDKRYSRLLGKLCEHRNNLKLLLQAVILHFKVIITLSENGIVPKSSLLCTVIVPCDKLSCNFSCKAARKRNNSLVVLFQKLFIDSRLDIEARSPRFRHHFDKVFVARFVFTQQNKMVPFGIYRMYLVVP